MLKPLEAKILGLLLIIASIYFFFRAVELVSGEKPFFISSAIALLVGLLVLDYGVKLVEKSMCSSHR